MTIWWDEARRVKRAHSIHRQNWHVHSYRAGKKKLTPFVRAPHQKPKLQTRAHTHEKAFTKIGRGTFSCCCCCCSDNNIISDNDNNSSHRIITYNIVEHSETHGIIVYMHTKFRLISIATCWLFIIHFFLSACVSHRFLSLFLFLVLFWWLSLSLTIYVCVRTPSRCCSIISSRCLLFLFGERIFYFLAFVHLFFICWRALLAWPRPFTFCMFAGCWFFSCLFFSYFDSFHG